MSQIGIGPLGLKDQPITNRDEEALGLGEYAEVLTEFIQGCDTPMTIALQGDWGSGKTSLMTLIRNDLHDDGRYLTVWFNTWQYSQFNMETTLALSMMSNIADSLAPEKGTDTFKKLKRSLGVATRAVAIGGATIVGQGYAAKEVMNELKQGVAKEENEEDSAASLERIKEGLMKVVAERTNEKFEKVVVFIDDLDRLVPQRAVELLEAMKVFLDIDRCVYVIACDYSVVAKGLQHKFGISEAELKGKSFFDKIIQVPFKMPTRRYQVHGYIESLLKRIGVDYDGEADIEKYSGLVEYSVGFNPRTMKRILNTLQLLTILSRKRDGGKPKSSAQHQHDCRVTFATLCMHEHYEVLYDYLTAEVLTAKRIENLRDQLVDGEDFKDIRDKIVGKYKTGENTESLANESEIIQNAGEFVSTFIDCLQLDDDASLSDEEIRSLEEMLSISSLVSAGRQVQEFEPRDFAFQLRSDLNTRYSRFVGSLKPKYDKFRKSQGAVKLHLPILPGWLLMGRENETYYFDVRSKDDSVVQNLGSLICESLGWEDGKYLEGELEFIYRFFSQSADMPDALEEFRTELFSRLDTLTYPKKRVFGFCSQVADRTY